ncbi:MAG TPA: RHS repeat-associated core domain-containing protein [Pseudomonas sp.]|uniref:RHS repeat domain-containing protein n=1 Tax=Pseudomonas sp. TaxID=306 RepID=UPI002EDA7CBB
MDGQSVALHRGTPTISVIDPRRLPVRSVDWCRTQVFDSPEVRINGSTFDQAGRLVNRWDARLWRDQAPANLTSIHSVSGQVLLSESVDAGWRISLSGESGKPLQVWDSRGTVLQTAYDGLLRPSAVFENGQCVERLSYGGADLSSANQCGQLIRHDDPAGTRLSTEFTLAGGALEQTQHFVGAFDHPDWPEPLAERDALREPGTGATTRWAYNPLGEAIAQTDTLGNVQSFAHMVAGQLKECRLQLKDQPEQALVSRIRYDAQGRIESQAAGNGVVTTARYREEDGRLIQLQALREEGGMLQDLNYAYDPVGNVTRIEDHAQSTRYFANQKIDAVSTFAYDTLYQLIEATGREAAVVNQGPVFPSFQSPADPSQLANYTQTYQYDAGGNLQKLSHVGAQNHSIVMVTANQSNRSLPVVDDIPPTEADIADGFDANGNLRALQPGQTLEWDLRNQLQQVRPVVRESGNDDCERYIYDASGQRMRKIRMTQAKAVVHTDEVRYLPGLEVRSNTATGEVLQVITVQAGRNSVRVLHWQSDKPDGIDNDQYRYALTDHLGSCTLELDQQAQRISQESYYPFGGTSWWAGRSEVDARYKTVRYSGKERDATGLYYYGLRYYAPWLMRWINPDPAGVVDGLNRFRFVRNSPLRFGDREGEAPYDVLGEQEVSVSEKYGLKNVARGLSEFSPSQKSTVLKGMKLAGNLLGRVSVELSKEVPGKGVQKVLENMFGEVSQEHGSYIVNTLKLSLDEQQSYIRSLSGESSWKISLFTGAPHIEGITYNKNSYQPEKVIALSAASIESDHILHVARTLIHESSHATADTVDVFYNRTPQLPQGADSQAVEGWSKSIRAGLRTVASRGLEGVSVNATHYSNIMDHAAGHSITPAMQNLEFIGNPFVRASVLLRNADTYSSFVMGTKLPARIMRKKNAAASSSSFGKKYKEVF